MEEIKVKKRDGMLEDWNFDKLVTSISKAGVPVVDAETIARSVEGWVKDTFPGTVTSLQLRDKVIEEMKVNFPSEADSYQAYKKG